MLTKIANARSHLVQRITKLPYFAVLGGVAILASWFCIAEFLPNNLFTGLKFFLTPLVATMWLRLNQRGNSVILASLSLAVWCGVLMFFDYAKSEELTWLFHATEIFFRLVAVFVCFLVCFLVVELANNANNKTAKPYFFIPIAILCAVLLQGLLSRVVIFGLSVAVIFWAVRWLMTGRDSQAIGLNILASLIIIFGLNYYIDYINNQTQQQANIIANKISHYHKQHQKFPDESWLNLPASSQIRYYPLYKNQDCDPTFNKIPMTLPQCQTEPRNARLYYQAYEDPYCQADFDFANQTWGKQECRD